MEGITISSGTVIIPTNLYLLYLIHHLYFLLHMLHILLHLYLFLLLFFLLLLFSPSSSFNQKGLEPCRFSDENRAVEEDFFLLPAISERKYNVLQCTKQSPTPIRN